MIKLFVNIKKERIEIDLSNKDFNERIMLDERILEKYNDIMKAIFKSNDNKMLLECLINNNKYEKILNIDNITFFVKSSTDSKNLISMIESILLDREHYEIMIDIEKPFNKEIDITKILKSDMTYVEDIEKFTMYEHRNLDLRKKRGYKDISCGNKIILLYEDI